MSFYGNLQLTIKNRNKSTTNKNKNINNSRALYFYKKNMEKTNLQYSTKNIPTKSKRNYKAKLLEKIEAVIQRMR